jgi:ADP-heptose:LPS heptosyltransferase
MRHGDPKSIPFERFAPLFSSGKHVFISLQHGDISDDLKMAQQKNWPLYEDTTINQQTSIDDFAAQICATDEVISVSNSTAHLAGALGIQGHVLLAARKGLMWHWFKSDAQSLWYPSLILLRQKTDGDWSDVLANLFKKFC